MAENTSDKIYDYDRMKVREKIVWGFRQTGTESTVADLAGLTGLPLQQLEAELPAVSDEFGARLKVTEKGEILYSFPRGMKSRFTGFGPRMKKILRALAKGAVEGAKALFKVWIVVMLVGYFIIFLGIALFSLVASVAVQQGGGGRSRNDRRGGGLGGLWLTTRLFDTLIRIWFYSELFKGPERRGFSLDRGKKRPLHKAVFSHVFGDGDPNKNWATIEKRAVLAFLQSHKGLITMPEFMAIMGMEAPEAEAAINAYLLEFEGSPEVSDSGCLYYSFPKLLAKAEPGINGSVSPLPLKRLGLFSSNSPKADRTFRLINVFNLAFGGYFLYNALTVGSSIYINTVKGLALKGGFAFIYSAAGYLLQLLGSLNPVPTMFWGLGVVPLIFSGLFFAVPVLRSLGLKRHNEAIKFENLRRIFYGKVIKTSGELKPEEVVAPMEEARPADPAAAERIARNLAAWSEADVTTTGYEFKEIGRGQADIERLRSAVDEGGFAPGKTVFDTEA
ncbi:MAG: hypothetical protein NT061_08610 [Spirochaetes bacterium]|nr:hypothetical protein [Spirochaetota bacterium]